MYQDRFSFIKALYLSLANINLTIFYETKYAYGWLNIFNNEEKEKTISLICDKLSAIKCIPGERNISDVSVWLLSVLSEDEYQRRI